MTAGSSRVGAASSAVVTGIGVVAPNGFGVQEHWDATLAGRSGIGAATRFDTSGYPVGLAGEVSGFTPTGHLPGSLVVQTDRGTQLGLVAAEMALADAELDPAAVGEFDMAVVTASACGGVEFGQREIENLWSKGPRTVGPFQSIAWFYAATTGQISIRHGMRGACGVVAAEQAGGLETFAQGRRLIDRADARVVVAGGTESSLSPYGLVAQLTTDQVSRVAQADRAYLPFDEDASGYVPAEGGAMLIVEESAHADGRGAPHRYGRIAGYAATFDPGGRARPTLRRAIERALESAGLTPSTVDVVFADAAGVPEQDAVEAAVLAEVFGPHGVPVAVPKGLVGRLHAGGAALDVVAALLAIRDGVLPPGGATRPAAYHRIDLVTEPRELPVRTALVVARGYGGFNAALVVTAPN
jgi:act minimal PKS chain-length factor (CLF/KS beta)